MRALVIAVAALAGCVDDAPFECRIAADCARGGEQGVCEPTGFCSFADASCGAALRRYGDLAGLDLAGTCVPCIAELDGGGSHVCARSQEGELHCWGANDRGQIGDGFTTERLLPVEIAVDREGEPLGRLVDVGLGSTHSCAVGEGGQVWCWGGNSSRQTGDETLEIVPEPSPVAAGAIAVAAGLSHTCWLAAGGAIRCIGDNTASQLGADQDAVSLSVDPITALADGAVSLAVGAGAFHTCAVLDDASLSCWGGNDDGQIGNGTTENARGPVPVRPAASTRAAVTGDRFSCAIGTGGEALCWGDNAFGQLGDGSLEQRDVPTAAALPAPASQIALGDDHACARLEDGSLWCWGSNALGQLGPAAGASEPAPVPVREAGVVMVACAADTTCFLEASGDLFCMGAGSSGERGDGREEDSAEPVPVGLACER